jgi:hypothetical protein
MLGMVEFMLPMAATLEAGGNIRELSRPRGICTKSDLIDHTIGYCEAILSGIVPSHPDWGPFSDIDNHNLATNKVRMTMNVLARMARRLGITLDVPDYYEAYLPKNQAFYQDVIDNLMACIAYAFRFDIYYRTNGGGYANIVTHRPAVVSPYSVVSPSPYVAGLEIASSYRRRAAFKLGIPKKLTSISILSMVTEIDPEFLKK